MATDFTIGDEKGAPAPFDRGSVGLHGRPNWPESCDLSLNVSCLSRWCALTLGSAFRRFIFE
jgi:hypothetical protein